MADPNEIITSVKASDELKVDPSTTKRAAASGLVAGASRNERPGAINAPWCATRQAWADWSRNRLPVGRPQTPVLSRLDTAVITRAKWVDDPKDPDNICWWTVWTDKTDDTAFRTVGFYKKYGTPTDPEIQRFAQGNTIRLADLSFCPVPVGIIAYTKSERGEVLATIGRIRDQLERHCGPLTYLIRHCKTRSDTVDPSAEQVAALESALHVLMNQGVKAALASLEESRLFESVWQGNEGCPFAPMFLPDGVREWR